MKESSGPWAYHPLIQVPGLTGITAVAAGTYHSLALRNDGTLLASGGNMDSKLGNGTVAFNSTPELVSLP